MSVKIKVSYQHDHELKEVIALIKPRIKRCSKSEKHGKYNRVYIDIK